MAAAWNTTPPDGRCGNHAERFTKPTGGCQTHYLFQQPKKHRIASLCMVFAKQTTLFSVFHCKQPKELSLSVQSRVLYHVNTKP